jgi:predicted enzyme related to lactoylglutathione lyase
MNISSYTIAFDCGNVAKLAQFWSALLSQPVGADSSEEFASLERGGTAPGMIFCKVPEPITAKNRVHLDLTVAALDDEVDRIVALGAREVARFDQDGSRWVTLTDPEGNVFDLVAA